MEVEIDAAWYQDESFVPLFPSLNHDQTKPCTTMWVWAAIPARLALDRTY